MFDLPIIKGIGFGLLIAVLLGPVFFALIQTSITKGFRAGAGMAVGIVLSDAFCVAISFLGLMQVVQGPVALRWIGIIGGLFMLIYGIVLLLSRKVQSEAVHLPDVNTGLVFGGSLAKGFLLNMLNPFVIVYWLGVSSFVSSMPLLRSPVPLGSIQRRVLAKMYALGPATMPLLSSLISGNDFTPNQPL